MAEREYIERDAVLKKLKECGAICEFGQHLIKNFPAADVAPVRHGHWISHDDYFEDAKCSECGDVLDIGECSFDDFCECYHFCPNCGAKMDGKRKEILCEE